MWVPYGRTWATDVLYVVRPGKNEELRYSLRSIAANLPHKRVVIAGAAPEWVRNLTTVAVDRVRDKYQQTTLNILTALPQLSDWFVLMNDDFFVMQPWDATPLHRGSLKEVAATHRNRAYARRLEDMAGWLEAHGYPSLCYELHAPMLVERSELARCLRVDAPGKHEAKRSLYGNRAYIGGRETHDFKTTEAKDWPVLSTNEASFSGREVGRLVRQTFAKPSHYEAEE